MKKNPKLEGSELVDVIPQTGKCPMKCLECFYNEGFFRTLDEPLIVTDEEAKGKIVRVNTGHDSNINKKLVIEITKIYQHKFYNTSIPNFDFPGPVVFTCNSRDTDFTFFKVEDVSNVMFVRIRVDTWNLASVVDPAVAHYTKKGIPVVLTFMRYKNKDNVKKPNDYYLKKHIQNSYWLIKAKAWRRIMDRYKGNDLVFSCGTPQSSLCKDCQNCVKLYWRLYWRKMIRETIKMIRDKNRG